MKSKITESFVKRFRKLPTDVQIQATRAYRLFKREPYHSSLHFKCIDKDESLYSARVGISWRVLGVWEGDTISWFWIGSHEEYNTILKKR